MARSRAWKASGAAVLCGAYGPTRSISLPSTASVAANWRQARTASKRNGVGRLTAAASGAVMLRSPLEKTSATYKIHTAHDLSPARTSDDRSLHMDHAQRPQ